MGKLLYKRGLQILGLNGPNGAELNQIRASKIHPSIITCGKWNLIRKVKIGKEREKRETQEIGDILIGEERKDGKG